LDAATGCSNVGNIVPDEAHTWHQKCGNKTIKRKTLMYSSGSNGPRLLQYSNPDINLDGYPTGVSDVRDNASVIINHACNVANYRPDPVTVSQAVVNILGGHEVCYGQSIEMQAHVACGLEGPFQYEWYKSHDGINWGNVVNTSNSYFVGAGGFSAWDIIYLRLKITSSSNNQVEYAYREVEVLSTSDCTHPIIGNNDVLAQVSISPNPTSDNIRLAVDVAKEGSGKIELIDLNGKIVSSISSVKWVEGRNTFSFATVGMGSGIYFVSCISETGVVTKKVAIR